MIQITRISLLNVVNSIPFQFTILEIPQVKVGFFFLFFSFFLIS